MYSVDKYRNSADNLNQFLFINVDKQIREEVKSYTVKRKHNVNKAYRNTITNN